MLQRQSELGSSDVVSLREGLGTSDGPTPGIYCKSIKRGIFPGKTTVMQISKLGREKAHATGF